MAKRVRRCGSHFAALRSEAAYGRVLLQRLAAAVPVAQNAAQALARERAEAVRAALLERGVDPARVGLADARETSGAAQIATALWLKPADPVAPAGVGATSSTIAPPPADPVRAAQEKLNAGGYDAGPVDGILGPRSKRALIHFQAVEGLELTGQLDAATRARLKR